MDAAHVVGADEEDGELGVQAVELAVFEAPEQVGGGVALEAEVEGVAGAVITLPHGGEVPPGFGPGLLPVLRDAVAEPDEIDPAAPCFGELGLVAGTPPAGFHAADGGGGDGLVRRLVGGGEQEGGGEEEGVAHQRLSSQAALPRPKTRQ